MSGLPAERSEPLSAGTPRPLTVHHERRDDPQLVVGNEGGSVGQDVGVAEEFRDVEFPLQALVSRSQNQGAATALVVLWLRRHTPQRQEPRFDPWSRNSISHVATYSSHAATNQTNIKEEPRGAEENVQHDGGRVDTMGT